MNATKPATALALLWLGVLVGCRAGPSQPASSSPFQWVLTPLVRGAEDPVFRANVTDAAEAMEFEEWPRSRVLRRPPPMGELRRLLVGPAHSSVQETTSYEAVGFKDGLWGQALWSCSFWPQHRRTACVSVRLALCPSSRAAAEMILLEAAKCDLPVPVAVSLYFQPIEKLGNVAFGRQDQGFGEVRFARDNMFVHVNATGVLASEAVPLARKIDALIRKQRRVSYRGLVARRPEVQIPPTAGTADSAEPQAVCCRVAPAKGQKVVCCNAWVDGFSAQAGPDGRIELGPRAGPKWVNLTVVTDELLARSCEGMVRPAGSGQGAGFPKQ